MPKEIRGRFVFSVIGARRRLGRARGLLLLPARYGALITPPPGWCRRGLRGDTTFFPVFAVLAAQLCLSAMVVTGVLGPWRQRSEAVRTPEAAVREAGRVD
ncbi:hypothetical protein [Streptomyces sp. NPDC045369]|uniref:hypothetical protein n=1 Tax=Streptomyces sp. NPDC045369 TaxID=3155732 RepID=UPI0033E1E8FE